MGRRQLAGSVAIVTGASSGIGAATAVVLAAHGVHVVLVARRLDRLQALAGDLAARYGVRTLAVPADLSRRVDIDRLVAETLRAFGRIDILVNNAGLGMQGDVANLAEHQVRYLFDVNVYGPLLAMQAVAPIMARQGGGAIVNVSSILGKVVVPSLGMVGSSAAYTASKFALDAFSAAARMELASQKIDVITVLPGVTRSEFNDAFLVSNGGRPRTVPKSGGLLGVVPPERVAQRIVRAIERGEREVYVTAKDRLIVMGATAMPGLWEWALVRLRAWRMADRSRLARATALVTGASAALLAVAVGFVVGSRRRRASAPE
ncbi:MAG: SDR family NAD(P)-dependent oxidoreductase [Caldilinea sp.]|nr:SDR family NAD(P)-dependent oxidoreductase [Caldilinea sp.]